MPSNASLSSTGAYLVSGYAKMTFCSSECTGITLASAKSVYCTIALHVNDQHICWIGADTICALTHFSRRTVSRGIKALVDGGYIEIVSRAKPGRVATYRWLNPEELKLRSTGEIPSPVSSGSTRGRSLEDDLMDYSWVD